MTHPLTAFQETCRRGYFDAGVPPVLTVRSGERVAIGTVSGGSDALPPEDFHVPPVLRTIHAAEVGTSFGPHMLNGRSGPGKGRD